MINAEPSKLESARKRWLQLILIVSVIVVVPAVISPKLPETRSQESVLDDQPEVIFVGNSMLATRIDIEHYERINQGRSALALIDQGLKSAAWYLRIKNYVVHAGANPKTVFVFFRTDALTDPDKSTSGRARSEIDNLKSGDEQLFDSVVNQNQNLDQNLSLRFREIYSIGERNSSAVAALERTAASVLFPNLLIETARRAASIVGFGSFDRVEYNSTLDEYIDLNRSTNEIFDLGNFRQTEEADTEIFRVPEFGSVVESSLLPAMIDLVAESDIQLVFVMVQKRPNADGTTKEVAGLPEYTGGLEVYLASRGVGFINMNNTPEISSDKYLVGDHISPNFMDEYTEIFSRKSAEFAQ